MDSKFVRIKILFQKWKFQQYNEQIKQEFLTFYRQKEIISKLREKKLQKQCIEIFYIASLVSFVK